MRTATLHDRNSVKARMAACRRAAAPASERSNSACADRAKSRCSQNPAVIWDAAARKSSLDSANAWPAVASSTLANETMRVPESGPGPGTSVSSACGETSSAVSTSTCTHLTNASSASVNTSVASNGFVMSDLSACSARWIVALVGAMSRKCRILAAEIWDRAGRSTR